MTPRVRLTGTASLTVSSVGVMLRSDLNSILLQGGDAGAFARKIVPVLERCPTIAEVAEALPEYSSDSIFRFLALLDKHGIVTACDDGSSSVHRHPDLSQTAFFQRWARGTGKPLPRLSEVRILVVGLEPWGVALAAELAAAGVGSLHVLDDEDVVAQDLLLVRLWNAQHIGRRRRDVLTQVLSEIAPDCRVSTGPLELSHKSGLALNDTRWNLILGAVSGDEFLILKSLAHFGHDTGVGSLVGYLEGIEAVVGPAVTPGKTACWNCCRLRQLANSANRVSTQAFQLALLSSRPLRRHRTCLAPMAPFVGHLMALEALKLVSGYTPSQLFGRVLVQNLVTLNTSFHALVPMPWCEICGGASAGVRPPGPADTWDSDESNESDDQRSRLDRITDTDALRKLLSGWVDARTGVVSRWDVDGDVIATGEGELPECAIAVFAPYVDGDCVISEPQIGWGKGLTRTEAMIGAVAEGFERYSAARYDKSSLVRSSLNNIDGDALDPRSLSLYDETQYDEPGFPYARFDPDKPIDWTRGWWADTGKLVWMPSLPTYFGYHAAAEEQFCQTTSSGLAAGSDIADASLRALFELIERDAFMITWFCRMSARKVVVDCALESGVREIIRQLEGQGAHIELYLLDVGVSTPTIACVGRGDGEHWPGVTMALGAHASARTAARKAVLEQGHVGRYIRRLMLEETKRIPHCPKDVRSVADHALYYVPRERNRALDFLCCSGDPISIGDLKEPREVSINSCAEDLLAAGVRVAVADLTSPDVACSPFRVARALGTGMQPLHFGFGLERVANPRLRSRLVGPVNREPHPLA